MEGCKFSLICLIVVFSVIEVRSETELGPTDTGEASGHRLDPIVTDAASKAAKYLLKRTLLEDGLKYFLPRTVVALAFAAGSGSIPKNSLTLLKEELNNQITKRLSQEYSEPSPIEFAHYINALVATCQDPTNFHFQGMNLVEYLRFQVRKSYIFHDFTSTDLSPFVLLTLCIAGNNEKIDIWKLVFLFDKTKENNKLDLKALMIMALACPVEKNPDYPRNIIFKEEVESDFNNVNIHTKALSLQGLHAMGVYDTDKLSVLLEKQLPDGSFGDLLSTYYAIPALLGKSLSDLKCESSSVVGHNPCGLQIPCDDSQCIEREKWCNFFDECTDGSDEKYCDKKSFWTTPDNKCDAERHFTCKNRMCIPKVLRCDGYDDCLDDSDEKDCESSEDGGITMAPDPLNNNIAESTHSFSTDVPTQPSTTEFPHSLRPVEPTVDFYGNRLTEEGNTPRQPYNSPTATASAYPPIHPPHPTPDSRNPPASGWNRNERSFGNVDSRSWSGYLFGGATTKPPPPQEPCDKTISRSDDGSASRYHVPWSHFTFESSHGDAIRSQYNYQARRAQEWLLAQRDTDHIWGANTPRALVALALSSDATHNMAADDILQRRLRIDLGARLIKWRQGKRSLSASGLALYINALIATCQNPRNMYERDLVEMLYLEVQKERAARTDASPFPYITLCLADRPLTEDDRRFLLDIAGRHVTDEISKDKFILATSALACLKKALPHNRELERSVDEAFSKLQDQQLKDESFGSVYSTALAAQALIAIDSPSWNHQSTLRYLSSKQHEDGSFGDFLATYYALPVLSGKSLLHLRNVQCGDRTCENWNCHHLCRMTQTGPECYCHPGFELDTTDRKTCIDRCQNWNCQHLCRMTHTGPDCYCRPGFELDTDRKTCIEIPTTPPTKTVLYRLEKQIEKSYSTLASLNLDVPQDDSFFEIMKKAPVEDSLFSFLFVEHDNKIDVYQISDIPNDPEFGWFWVLYKVERRNGHIVSKQRYTQDIRQLIPENADELLFSYENLKPGSQ